MGANWASGTWADEEKVRDYSASELCVGDRVSDEGWATVGDLVSDSERPFGERRGRRGRRFDER